MDYKISQQKPVEAITDALLIPVFKKEGIENLPLPKRLRTLIAEIAYASGDFDGKKQEVYTIPITGAVPKARRIVLIGLGEREKYDLSALRNAMAATAKSLKKYAVESIALLTRAALLPARNWNRFAQTVVEGFELGSYKFDLYKSKEDEEEEKKKELKSIFFLRVPPQRNTEVEDGVQTGKVLSEATSYTRNLCNQPPNVVNPEKLAEEAEALSANLELDCEIIEQSEMEKMGMNALLGVAKGSKQPPKLIVLKYFRGTRDEKPIALVGKGVTFDSGGISLKPGKNMDEMKYDMSGGAVVLGTMMAIAMLKLPINIVGVVPAVENLPDGNATKPGDILRAMSGKTIEVLNTDAEGRLILADALTYVQKEYKPEIIVDLATLTGAVVVALGNAAAGLMGNNEELKKELQKAGQACGERLWPLPLYDEYKEQIKSDIADIKNIGGGPAGVTVGGAFLSHFIAECAWAHIDIAGVAWTTKDTPLAPKGATGFGVRLLGEWLKNRMAQKK